MVHSTAPKSFPPSIHVPSLTWFANDATQEIDWPTQTEHIKFLISSGLHGIVLAGTNGEAVTLSPQEKSDLVSTTRKLANELGRPEVTITLGCGGQSTRDVIAETRLAKEAGADFALVLVPSYFHFAMHEDAIVEFFQELGSHQNIVGVKLTCGGIAKVARIRAQFSPDEFRALAGQSDWLIPALAVGATGTITGVANLYPKYCIEMYNLWTQGKTKEAEKAQMELAKMEWGFAKGGINAGLLFLFSSWYTKRELAKRISILYAAGKMAGAFGGLLGSAIMGGMDGKAGLAAWGWLSAFILPNYPDTTEWLTEQERYLAILRIAEDANEQDVHKSSSREGLKLAFTDPSLYILWFMQLSLNTAAAFTNFFPTIVKTLGYNKTQTLLLSAPPYVFAAIRGITNS
ncbi:aldolase, partial [Aureobasidium melanogenum]